MIFYGLNSDYFYIKESVRGGNRIIKAVIGKDISGEKRFPEYYSKLNLSRASWVRIVELKIVDKNEFLSSHTLRNGNEIKALDRGNATILYVIDFKGK